MQYDLTNPNKELAVKLMTPQKTEKIKLNLENYCFHFLERVI